MAKRITRTFTDEERKEYVKKVRHLISQGQRAYEACLVDGGNYANWHAWSRKFPEMDSTPEVETQVQVYPSMPKAAKTTYKKREPSKKLVALIGNADEIAEAIRGVL